MALYERVPKHYEKIIYCKFVLRTFHMIDRVVMNKLRLKHQYLTIV